MKYSKGNWKTGNGKNCVVTDNPEGMTHGKTPDEIKYYGGYLIAESIFKEADRKLIASAPDLLEALIDVVRISDRKHDAWDKAKEAIKKATE